MPIKACVFDAYGTLFDVAALRASHPQSQSMRNWRQAGRNWQRWRTKQLQYTWLRAITGDYTDFWQVTQDGLDFAMAALGLEGEAECANVFWRFIGSKAMKKCPKVTKLNEQGFITAILSNGYLIC